jgi:hypothetical protein
LELLVSLTDLAVVRHQTCLHTVKPSFGVVYNFDNILAEAPDPKASSIDIEDFVSTDHPNSVIPELL